MGDDALAMIKRTLNSHCCQSLKSNWASVMKTLPSAQAVSGLSDKDDRQQLAADAYTLGSHCYDAASAFLAGYQMAVRCIDTRLKSDQWGAFCVNERGVNSLRLMSTTWDGVAHELSGQKSFALMAGQGLDSVIVIARGDYANAGREPAESMDQQNLVAVKIALPTECVEVIPATKPGRILPTLPHSALTFDRCSNVQMICAKEAHNRLNKPFRFWEDIMVTLSFCGWMRGYLADELAAQLHLQSQQLIEYFGQYSAAYDLQSLRLVEQLHKCLNEAAHQLPHDLLTDWQRDKQILSLAQVIRDRIKNKLTAAG